MAAVAQPTPASLQTVTQPTSGPAVFDSAGNVYYLSGPVTAGAAQTQPGGGTCYPAGVFLEFISAPCSDASAVKVDSKGNIVFGTLLGGPTADTGTALAVDASGSVFLTGSTGGRFPTTPGAAIANSTTSRVFAARLSADGTKFLYSTYLPDTAATSSAIALDANDNAYIVGKTSTGHAYVTKLSADGSVVFYNVVLAGSRVEAATAIAIDSAGNAMVAGETTSSDFPVTANALQGHLAGTGNIFLARIDPTGKVLSATYLGGSGTDIPTATTLDGAGNLYLAGSTTSLDFPTTAGTMQSTPIVPAWNNLSPAGFVARIAPDGSALQWSSYVMSSDIGTQIGVGQLAVTAAGDVVIGGVTGPGFPVTASAPQICFGGTANRTNGFVAHLDSSGTLLDATYLGPLHGTDVDAVEGLLPTGENSVSVAWHDGGNDVVSNVRFGRGGWTAPACLSTSVLKAATQSGGYGIAAGELVTLTGFGLGPDVGIAYQPDTSGQYPFELAGVQVFFDHVAVPIFYAQSRQLNVAAPQGLKTNSTTTVEVTYQGQTFGPVSTPVVFSSPGVFRMNIGQSSEAVAMNQDWTYNSASNPAARGSYVTLFTTGYGDTVPVCPWGGLNNPLPVLLSPGITPLIFDGSIIHPSYFGSAPKHTCGIVQVNFQVPMSASPGNYYFVPWVRYSDATTNILYQPPVGATIVVK